MTVFRRFLLIFGGVFFLIGLLGWAPPARPDRAGPAGTGTQTGVHPNPKV